MNVPEVLGNRDYARLLYLSPAYRSFLEVLFSSYTVLFVGFGGNDPDLDGVVDRLSKIYERSLGQHFILISEDEFSALERRRLLDDKRLDCITYRRDASHSQVVEFLRALSQRMAPDAEVETPFVREKRQPRVFISGSYRKINLLREVAEAVEQAGFDAWFADTKISAGDRIVDVITKAIDEADCLIAVLSEDAAASSWMHFESAEPLGRTRRFSRFALAMLPCPRTSWAFFALQ